MAGHIVVDEIIDRIGQVSPRELFGAAPSYSSLALSSLGYKPEIVTDVGEDFPVAYIKLIEEKTGIDIRKWIFSGIQNYLLPN